MNHDQQQRDLFPGLWGALWLLLASLLIETVMSALVFDLMPDAGGPMEKSALARVLAYGVLFTALLQYKRMSHAELFHSGPASLASTASLTLLPVLALVPGMLVVSGWMGQLRGSVFEMSRWEESAFSSMLSTSPGAIALVCVIAPVLEEMLFRGVILRAFLLRYPPGTAIVHSAAIFGLAHMNIYQFVSALAMGLVLGWLYERTRSLLPCIVLHAASNTTIVWLSQTAQAEDSGADMPILLSLLVSVAAMVWLVKRLGWPSAASAGQASKPGQGV